MDPIEIIIKAAEETADELDQGGIYEEIAANAFETFVTKLKELQNTQQIFDQD